MSQARRLLIGGVMVFSSVVWSFILPAVSCLVNVSRSRKPRVFQTHATFVPHCVQWGPPLHDPDLYHDLSNPHPLLSSPPLIPSSHPHPLHLPTRSHPPGISLPPTSQLHNSQTCKVIFYHYRGNIYTTLTKLHLASNTFQRLSAPHGMAGGLASIRPHQAVRQPARPSRVGEMAVCCNCVSLPAFAPYLSYMQQGSVATQIAWCSGVHRKWKNGSFLF